MLDIGISVALGALMLLSGYLGVHVTLHPAESPRDRTFYKCGFWFCGLLALGLIGLQAYRTNKSQESNSRLLSEISKSVASLSVSHNGEGTFFITEKAASEIILFLWSTKAHSVALISGGSFGDQSFANQVRELLRIGRWDIRADIHVFPGNAREIVVQGKFADDTAVLALQRFFSMAGLNAKFEPKGKTEIAQSDVILRLP